MLNYTCGHYHNWIRNLICHSSNDTEQFSFITLDTLFQLQGLELFDMKTELFCRFVHGF